jgi:hypothetical protein
MKERAKARSLFLSPTCICWMDAHLPIELQGVEEPKKAEAA